MRQQLQAFQQHVPLITALRNPGLRDRHWEKISAAVGCPVKADAGKGVWLHTASKGALGQSRIHASVPCAMNSHTLWMQASALPASS